MNLYHLRVFLTVAEHEHITRASEELILSQPAVTKIIQSLEHEVGFDLIERHGRRIVLTHAGRVLHGYARRMFALEREIEEALAAMQDIEAGEITLAANTTAGVYLLPSIIAKYRANFPQVKLNMTILNSQQIIEQTLNWGLDFGLVEGDVAVLPPGLEATIFAYDELILVVAPTHPWSHLHELSPEALRDEQLILREQGSGIRESIEHELQHMGVQIQPLLTLPDNEAIKQMVMSGVGAAIVSALAVRRELAAGDLIRIPITNLELRPQLILISRIGKQLSRAAQTFCKLLHASREQPV